MSLNNLGASQGYHLFRAFHKVWTTVRQLVNVRSLANIFLQGDYHAPEIQGPNPPNFEHVGSQTRDSIPATMNRIMSKIEELPQRSVGAPEVVLQQVASRVGHFNNKLAEIEQEYQLLAQHRLAFVEAGYGFISRHTEDLHAARNRLSTSLLALEIKVDIDLGIVKHWGEMIVADRLPQPPAYSEGSFPPDYCEHPRDTDDPPRYRAI